MAIEALQGLHHRHKHQVVFHPGRHRTDVIRTQSTASALAEWLLSAPMPEMDSDTHALLLELDDPKMLDYPEDYDHKEALARVASLLEQLNQLFGCSCHATTDIQDASFTADVTVPPDATKTGRQLWARISNFGLLAIFGLDSVRSELTDAEVDAAADPDDQMLMRQALTNTGYVIVPKDTLHCRYDGANEHWRNWEHPPITWFGRFFDYY